MAVADIMVDDDGRNCCFDVSSHPAFLNPEEVNLFPYILLPLMGSEEYDDEVYALPPPAPPPHSRQLNIA